MKKFFQHMLVFIVSLLAFNVMATGTLLVPQEITLEHIMAYSTDTDLYDRMDAKLIVQLTDDVGTGQINTAKVTALRADCSELINTYLRGKYTVPISPAPDILTHIEADLLVYKLYTRRGDYEVPESIVKADQKAMAMLKEINRGMILLPDQPNIAAGAIKTNKTASDRRFSDDHLKSF